MWDSLSHPASFWLRQLWVPLASYTAWQGLVAEGTVLGGLLGLFILTIVVVFGFSAPKNMSWFTRTIAGEQMLETKGTDYLTKELRQRLLLAKGVEIVSLIAWVYALLESAPVTFMLAVTAVMTARVSQALVTESAYKNSRGNFEG